MLISTDEYLERNGVYKMSLKELITFKDKICDNIKRYEDNKYTERVLELEVFMNPKPSVHYWWHCRCLIEVCSIIIAREDCDDKLKEKCSQDIDDAYMKIKKGLYDSDSEAFQKYDKLKEDKI